MPSSPASDGPQHEPRPPVAAAPAAPDEATPSGAALQDELARAEERYRRALADLANYRKRSERETQRGIAEAREALLRDWLEALDSVERALRVQPGDPGLQAVLEQMDAILARQGVVRTGTVGERFDPERAEAIGVVDSTDVPDRTVIEVARSGFGLGDGRLLRPAQVVVSRRPGGDG